MPDSPLPASGSSDELLPCPFCGGAPRLIDRESTVMPPDRVWFVTCYCGGYSATAHRMGDSREEVVALWNQRAPASGSTSVLDATNAHGENDDDLEGGLAETITWLGLLPKGGAIPVHIDRVEYALKRIHELRRALRESEGLIAEIHALSVPHAAARATPPKGADEATDGEEDTERIDALEKHMDEHGGANFTLWANEMVEVDNLSIDDPDDSEGDLPLMFDNVRDLLDELRERQSAVARPTREEPNGE